jgi:YbgC/YbaW family acyl-CoA thioester hydrolase
MNSKLADYEVLIREFHLDSLGHVNNAMYLSLLEEARWQIITDRGYGFEQVHRLQKSPVILEVNLKFMREIKLREKIRITLELLSYNGLIGSMKQQMIKADGKIAAEAVFAFGLFDLQTRKLVEPSPEWKLAIGLV